MDQLITKSAKQPGQPLDVKPEDIQHNGDKERWRGLPLRIDPHTKCLTLAPLSRCVASAW